MHWDPDNFLIERRNLEMIQAETCDQYTALSLVGVLLHFMNFHINLTQFYINFSRHRNTRYSFHGWRSRAKVNSFQPITPFIVLLQSL